MKIEQEAFAPPKGMNITDIPPGKVFQYTSDRTNVFLRLRDGRSVRLTDGHERTDFCFNRPNEIYLRSAVLKLED